MSPFLLAVPVFALVLNGWVIGAISGRVVAEQSLGYLLAGLLPHGVLELPAFFMGQAAAFSFGTAAMLAVFNSERRALLPAALRSNLKYMVIALVLFVPAALIEAFVTPLLIK
jgi:stage II sporulation protein M